MMQAISVEQIEARLRGLPPEKLAEVYDFVVSLGDDVSWDGEPRVLADEALLGRDWNRPEEDKAWRSL